MSLDLEAIRIRAALARSIAEGPNALLRALASADDVPVLLAEVERLTAALAASRLRECTALCRDVEEDRDSMLPVVEAVRARLAGGADDADALVAGVERMAAERDRYRGERAAIHRPDRPPHPD